MLQYGMDISKQTCPKLPAAVGRHNDGRNLACTYTKVESLVHVMKVADKHVENKACGSQI